MKYIYLDREKAKDGISLVFYVSDEKKNDYIEYFGGNAVEFYGKNLPHYITYIDETDSIREATDEEKINRGDIILEENQVLIDGKITKYNLEKEKIVNNKIVEKTRQDHIREGRITFESEINKAREQREKEYLAYHKLISNLIVGIEILSEEQISDIKVWHKSWKDVPNNYTNINISIEEMYPKRSEILNYYYK